MLGTDHTVNVNHAHQPMRSASGWPHGKTCSLKLFSWAPAAMLNPMWVQEGSLWPRYGYHWVSHCCFFSPPFILSSPSLASKACQQLLWTWLSPLGALRAKGTIHVMDFSLSHGGGKDHSRSRVFAVSRTKLLTYNSCLEMWDTMAQVTQKPLESCLPHSSPCSVLLAPAALQRKPLSG